MPTFEDELAALERRLDGLDGRVAARAAPALLDAAKGQWEVGVDPSGAPWPRTKDGSVALTDLTSQATGRADGAEIVIELPEVARFHQKGDRHLPQRKLVPDGEAMPPAWGAPIEAALRLELGEG